MKSLVETIQQAVHAKRLTHRTQPNEVRWIAEDELYDLIRRYEAERAAETSLGPAEAESRPLLEKLEALKLPADHPVQPGLVNAKLEAAIIVIRQHLTDPRTVEKVKETIESVSCVYSNEYGRFFDNGDEVAKFAIAAMGGASETGIGNHASTAHQQDHALTPPATSATNNSAAESGWIEWTGGECPVPPDTVVEVKWRDGTRITGIAKNQRWINAPSIPHCADIIRYRTVHPQRKQS